jgi:hypothetical protein
MNATATNVVSKPAGAKACGCGCQSGGECSCTCATRCCDLDCLVRPNFFCGQMLTDADLGALVDWTRSRFSLTRYREGWGIACGLDVTCLAPGAYSACCDDTKGPSVYLQPGYAIDCCGTDLVVCEPLRVDLSNVCRQPDDPCLPQTPPTGAQPGSGQQEEDCLRELTRGLFAVDLSLVYGETLAQSQRAMFRSGCSDDGASEYLRVLETPTVRLTVKPVDAPSADVEAERRWEEELRRERERAWAAIREASTQGLDELLRYVRHHPPHKLCFLEELICCLRKEGHAKVRDQDSYRWMPMWLYLDWFMSQVDCPCFSCRSDEGVPLARVLMSRRVLAGKTVCKVVFIDTSAKHRRALHQDPCRPIRRGGIDLTRLVGGYREDAEGSLAVHRIAFDPHELAAGDPAGHARVMAGHFTVEAGRDRPLRILTVRNPFGRDIVAGFED